MKLIKLNTKAVGYASILVFLAAALSNDNVRNAIANAIQKHDAATILSSLGVLAGFAMAYFGMPSPVPSSSKAPK